MSLVIFICMTIILIMAFFFSLKTMNILQNAYVLLLAIFLFTCYCSVIYVNLEFWKLSNMVPHYILFRIYEIIVIPVLIVWYCNGDAKKNLLIRAVSFTFGMYLIEKLLIGWNIISYVKWNGFASVLAYLLLLLVISNLNQWFTSVLRKEGIKVR